MRNFIRVRWLILVLGLLALAVAAAAILLWAVPRSGPLPYWDDIGASLSSSVRPLPATLAAPTPTPEQSLAAAPVYSYRILHTYPHDPTAFTQGLVYTDGVLYEGTGLYGDSSLRKVELETGQVLQNRDLPSQYFGEGIVVLTSTIIQLTWQEHRALLYDRDTFSETGYFVYPTQGWGLTYDGQRLVMSDGSSTLYFRDPETFSQTGQVQVLDGTTPVARLNELEYIRGSVYANVWLTDRIVRIDPATGQVTAWIDLAGLRPPGTDVLNGIAYDAVGERLFVTGKWWPSLFEIELVPPGRIYLPCMVR